MLKRKRYLILFLLVGFCSLFWWPVSVNGTLVDGETGEPIADVTVFVSATVWNLSAPLTIIGAGGDDSTVANGKSTSDDRGRFSVRIFSGIRLHNTRMRFDKAGYVFRPSMGGDHNQYSSDDYFGFFGLFKNPPGETPSSPTIKGWPETSDLVFVQKMVKKNVELPFDDVLMLGKQALQLRLDRDEVHLAVHVTLPGSTMRYVEFGPDEFDLLVAPTDGYHDEISLDLTCETRAKFFVVDNEKRYGWFEMNLGQVCATDPQLWVDYRFSNTPNIRALACAGDCMAAE